MVIIVKSRFSSPSSSSAASSVGSIERLSGDPGSAPHPTISHVWQGVEPRECVPVCAHSPPAALCALARCPVKSRPQYARKLLLETRRRVFERGREEALDVDPPFYPFGAFRADVQVPEGGASQSDARQNVSKPRR
ncbi:hypothetical protein Q8A67_020141 [Cirrhinus molitorella]|uniref:Uncharacterized protein n=1 Tax=Cirrhinus molitorella TaxID=172907 RepID=A0AA88P9S7_9TELE|nr:hypothetical protein Q8A67_020141 [Cirrhinus molitorella]